MAETGPAHPASQQTPLYMLPTPDVAERFGPSHSTPLSPKALGIPLPCELSQGSELTAAAGKSTSKSREVLHCGCHSPLGLQLRDGKSWGLPPSLLSVGTRTAKKTICQALTPRGRCSCRKPGSRTQKTTRLQRHRLSAQRWTGCPHPATPFNPSAKWKRSN